MSPCLYVGTSLGTVLALAIAMPPAGEQRQLQPVIISPTGGYPGVKAWKVDRTEWKNWVWQQLSCTRRAFCKQLHPMVQLASTLSSLSLKKYIHCIHWNTPSFPPTAWEFRHGNPSWKCVSAVMLIHIWRPTWSHIILLNLAKQIHMHHNRSGGCGLTIYTWLDYLHLYYPVDPWKRDMLDIYVIMFYCFLLLN